MSWYALCVRYRDVPTHASVSCYICNVENDYLTILIVTKGKWVLTSIRTGYKGKLTLILVSIQILQTADDLATLCCIHTTYLQPGQVIPHVPVRDNIKRAHVLEIVQKKELITSMCKCA